MSNNHYGISFVILMIIGVLIISYQEDEKGNWIKKTSNRMLPWVFGGLLLVPIFNLIFKYPFISFLDKKDLNILDAGVTGTWIAGLGSLLALLWIIKSNNTQQEELQEQKRQYARDKATNALSEINKISIAAIEKVKEDIKDHGFEITEHPKTIYELLLYIMQKYSNGIETIYQWSALNQSLKKTIDFNNYFMKEIIAIIENQQSYIDDCLDYQEKYQDVENDLVIKRLNTLHHNDLIDLQGHLEKILHYEYEILFYANQFFNDSNDEVISVETYKKLILISIKKDTESRSNLNCQPNSYVVGFKTLIESLTFYFNQNRSTITNLVEFFESNTAYCKDPFSMSPNLYGKYKMIKWVLDKQNTQTLYGFIETYFPINKPVLKLIIEDYKEYEKQNFKEETI